MVGGFKNTSSRLAIATAATVFAGGLALTPAQAADLGGDCCADLEERVAELEATTVRSGNRKLRVKLSGQVNSQLMYWDNGIESDIFVMDSDEASSRVRIDANGTIRPGLTAGLIIEFDVEIAGGALIGAGLDPLGNIATAPDDDGDRIQLRRANWFVKGSMGKISIGQGSSAADGALEVSFANTWVASVGYGLATTNINSFSAQNISAAAGTNVTWGTLGTDGDRFRRNRVRYDSPSLAGFTLSASWGEDDDYDVAVRYAKEFNGLKVAAAAMYNSNQDEGGDVDTYGGSIAMLHTPSGFHIQGGYATTEDQQALVNAFERDHMWIAAGVQFRGSDLGGSDIVVQYISNDLSNVAGGDADYDVFGVGFAQNIDAIGGTLYLSYNHHEADHTIAGVTASDDFDQVQFGMRLRY